MRIVKMPIIILVICLFWATCFGCVKDGDPTPTGISDLETFVPVSTSEDTSVPYHTEFVPTDAPASTSEPIWDPTKDVTDSGQTDTDMTPEPSPTVADTPDPTPTDSDSDIHAGTGISFN